MTNKEQTVAALQSLVTAAEMYLNTLDAVAKPATAAYLQQSIAILVTALDLNDPATAPELPPAELAADE